MDQTATGVTQLRHIWGSDPVRFQRELLIYLRAVLSAAAGDGVIGPAELAWVLTYAAESGLDPAGLRLLRNDDGKTEVEGLVAQLNPAALPEELTEIARALTLDAVRAAAADGDYDARERSRVHQMIGKLGLTREDVLAAERLGLGD